ncbi:hypothetical protein ACQ4PT_038130 [Festuca glaucescens]
MNMAQSARRAERSAAMAHLGAHFFVAGRSSAAALGAGPVLTSRAAAMGAPEMWKCGARSASTAATPVSGRLTSPASSGENKKEAASYWGVAPTRLVKEDGTEWKWSCFRDSYEADVSIDLTKHHQPATMGDKVARWTVKAMRWHADLFFQRRYGCRAMMLETVAAVPSMVASAVLHLRSLRRFEQSGGWIRALLEEAENERMHLMTFMEVSQPRWHERALVVAVQGVFFHVNLATYLLSPRVAHRTRDKGKAIADKYMLALEKELLEMKASESAKRKKRKQAAPASHEAPDVENVGDDGQGNSSNFDHVQDPVSTAKQGCLAEKRKQSGLHLKATKVVKCIVCGSNQHTATTCKDRIMPGPEPKEIDFFRDMV